MQHVMFDIDGTLVESFEFDEVCFTESVFEVLGENIDTDWAGYKDVTDSGLLREILQRSTSSMPVEEFESTVKPIFIAKVKAYLKEHGLQAINGAAEFIRCLQSRSDVAVSFATGGWFETAKMKLAAAGFAVLDDSIASSNDHYRRTEIMKIALDKNHPNSVRAPIYFGDAEWDKKACEELGFEFVLVGSRTEHHLQIDDYRDSGILQKLGL